MKDLGVGYKNFEKNASTVYGESSFPFNVSKEDLTKEMFSLASVHKNYPKEAAYGENSSAAITFRNTPEDKRNGSKMQIAIDAEINTLIGGPDYSNGARYWDGKRTVIVFK